MFFWWWGCRGGGHLNFKWHGTMAMHMVHRGYTPPLYLFHSPHDIQSAVMWLRMYDFMAGHVRVAMCNRSDLLR